MGRTQVEGEVSDNIRNTNIGSISCQSAQIQLKLFLTSPHHSLLHL